MRPWQRERGARSTYVMLLVKAGRTADAAALLDKAIAAEPQSPRVYAERAEFREDRGDRAGALADLEQAAEREASIFGLDRLATAFRRLGHADRALAVLQAAVEKAPKEAYAYLNRADHHMSTGNVAAAVDDADKAVAVNPTSDFIVGSRGQLLLRAGLYERSIADAEYGNKVRDGAGAALMANAKAKLGLLDEALAGLGEALARRPGDASLLFVRARLAEQAGDMDLAMADLTRLSELDKAYLPTRTYAQIRLGRADAAIGDLDREIDRMPGHDTIVATRGHAHLNLGDFARAEADAKRTLDIDAHSINAYWVQTQIALYRGDREAARQAADRMVQAVKPTVFTLTTRALIAAEAGKTDEAMRDIRAAAALDQRAAPVERTKGLIALLSGQYATAAAAFEAALRIDPDPVVMVQLALSRAFAGEPVPPDDDAVWRGLRHWPFPLVAHYRGEMAPEALLQLAQQPRKCCEASAALAFSLWIKGDKAGAKPLLETAAAPACNAFPQDAILARVLLARS